MPVMPVLVALPAVRLVELNSIKAMEFAVLTVTFAVVRLFTLS